MAHTFETQVRWTEELRGEIEAAGTPGPVPFAVPKEFGGPGDAWSPEHLLGSAVASCVLATFLSIARASKLEVSGYESTARTTMDKVEGALRITAVALDVRVTVAAEKDRDRAARMLEKAEKMCPISNSLKTGVTVKSAVEVAA
jgi:peroxiredoxin-like protein